MTTVEDQIVTRLIDTLLAAGFTLGVNDGEETVLTHSTDITAIQNALRSTDEDYILVYKGADQFSWVRLIWGNDTDVISDHGVNLTPWIDPIYDEINAL
jgi:hypothetical protein